MTLLLKFSLHRLGLSLPYKLKSISLLCCVNTRRKYSNRNILKLHERGMFQDLFPETSSNEVVNLLNAGPQCVYAGFDPTADSLHFGNLLVLINLLHWQRAGHKVIALVGGATGQIGDPSGRTSDRSELASNAVQDNSAAIRANIEQIFRNHETHLWKPQNKSLPLHPLTMVNNVDWYRDMNSVDFVSRVGRHFRMGTMLSRHSVHARLASEAGMSLTEFCYQVFQAYDWLHLYRAHDCRFQVGGNDQMGNIVSGHDLISRVADAQVYGLTLPLVTSESGNKFGKSANNAVWLNAAKSSPFELYQFLVRTRDADVERLLKLFTFKSLGQIADVMFKHQAKPEDRWAQTKLAEEVVLLVHGESGLLAAQQATATLYGGNIESLSKLTAQEIGQVFQGASVCELLLQPGTTALDASLRAGCFNNQSDAIRIIKAGGFYVNQQRVTNIEEVFTPAVHIMPNRVSLLRVGKKNYYLVKWLT